MKKLSMNTNQLFRLSLIVNGIGSCGLAVAFPYYLLSTGKSYSTLYTMQAVIFLLAAIGIVFWSSRIDRLSDLWNEKKRILKIEFLCSTFLLVSIIWHLPQIIICILIGILEFLFAFEIPWSRVAYRGLNCNQAISNKAQEITVAAALISIFAPTIGAYLGSQARLFEMSIINIITYMPYVLLISMIIRRNNVEKRKNQRKNNTPRREVFFFLWRNKQWRYLFIGTIWLNLSLGFLMANLPIAISEHIDSSKSISISAFYVFTGFIAVISNIKKVRVLLPSILNRSPLPSAIGIVIFGTLFLYSQAFFAKTVAYCLHNACWVSLNIFITAQIYDQKALRFQARLIGLFQIVNRFSIPLSALILSFLPISNHNSILIAIVLMCSVIGIAIFVLLAIVNVRMTGDAKCETS